MRNKFSAKPRVIYALLFCLLLVIEILIALFVRDRWLRPYGGDILVTVLLCCLARIVLPNRCRLLPLYIFLFAATVEILQYFDIVSLLGLSHIPFFRTLLGTTFSPADLVCYGVGCLAFWLVERLLRKPKQ